MRLADCNASDAGDTHASVSTCCRAISFVVVALVKCHAGTIRRGGLCLRDFSGCEYANMYDASTTTVLRV